MKHQTKTTWDMSDSVTTNYQTEVHRVELFPSLLHNSLLAEYVQKKEKIELWYMIIKWS